MNRETKLKKLTSETFDLAIIGGGASGLGVALDAVSRGLSVVLVEKHDYGKGTSSRSTKLVHGGVRYLQQGNVALVREALKERSYMLDMAGHNTHLQPFIIPFYSRAMGAYYYAGLKAYDLLSGRQRIGKTEWLSKKDTIQSLPTIKKKGLKGGIKYYDGQFDDSRLCIDLVTTIEKHGGICLNYMEMVEFLQTDLTVTGIQAKDLEQQEVYNIKARATVNATGVFTNEIVKKLDSNLRDIVQPSRGSHIVLDKSFLPGDHAIMIPKTSDGRVLFIIPWLESLLIGTTDVETESADIEPEVQEKEIQFILDNTRSYLDKKPNKSDIKAVFAGLRPLAAPKEEGMNTKEISRGHQVLETSDNLFTLIGGKWTTFRKMGEDVLKTIIGQKLVPANASTSSKIKIEKPKIPFTLSDKNPSYLLDEKSIEYLIYHEQALHLEDIIARRTRILFLDVGETKTILVDLAKIMADILGKDQDWVRQEIENCEKLLTQYLPPFIQAE